MRVNGVFRTVLVVLLVHVLCLHLASPSYADDAAVLPKGVFRATMDSNVYFPVDKRYNPDGKVEDAAIDFNRNLNSSVFSALAPLNAFVAGGSASIGTSVVSFEYDFTILEMGFQYGVTDSLTVGIRIPYWWVKNNVKARVDTSSANVGKNVAANSLRPLTVAGTVPLTTDDVQNLLGGGLDINGDGTVDIAGFGFKRIKTWSGDGVSDIEAGFRYQYLKTEDWRLAFTGGARFPTGRVDDINNLVDYQFGSGAYALLFRLNNDFVISNLWRGTQKSAAEGGLVPAPGDLVLNGTFRYDLVLPDNEAKRVPGGANNPITTNKEKVSRNLGDLFEFEASGKYGLLEGLNFSALYKHGFKLKDRVYGKKGFTYWALEEETKTSEDIYIIGLSYSTLPLYIEKKFPFPLNASISYRNRFAGSNNYLRSQFISAGLQIFF